ncbi:MAG: tRNA dihydrouridine synthase [Bdellovibrionales bacterium]
MTPSAFTPPFLQLAPMEGVLDWVLRELLSETGGVDRMVTEFVRVTDKLLPDHVFRRYCPELEFGGQTRAGTPVFVQLLGGQPGPMAENAARVVEIGAPGVDLNFGCPARTVNRHDGGAALLRDPERVFAITRAVREAVPVSIPVTAKVRLGFDHKDFHREIAHAAEAAGAAHLVVHARTKTEMYTPPAHWSYIRSMSENRTIPILANGDIWTVEDYARCVQESGAKRAALGRGLVRSPWLARAIRAHALGERLALDFQPATFLHRFFDASVAYRGEAYAVARLKQILRYWAPADSRFALWFTRAKVMQQLAEVHLLLTEIRLEEEKCHPYKFTPGPTVPTACARKIC